MQGEAWQRDLLAMSLTYIAKLAHLQ